MILRLSLALTLGLAALTTPAVAEDDRPDAASLRAAYERADRLRSETRGRVFKAEVVPHWSEDGARFWYRNDGRDGTREFILVDAAAGTRRPAFDHDRLAEALSKASGSEYRGDHLPFDAIEWLDDAGAIRFRVGDTSWRSAGGSTRRSIFAACSGCAGSARHAGYAGES